MMKVISYIKYYIQISSIDKKIKTKSFIDLVREECETSEKNSFIDLSALEDIKIRKKIDDEIIIIEKVSLIYPGKAKCLHRAILQYRLLSKRYNLPVKIIVGIQKFPFYSHAWLAWKNNQAIFELDENLIRYEIITDSDFLIGGKT